MKQYIDKTAVVAKLNELIRNYRFYSSTEAKYRFEAYTELLEWVDTLEVKEVDLEKEYEEFVVDDPIFGNFITNDTMGMKLAKHFFELGLKAQKEE